MRSLRSISACQTFSSVPIAASHHAGQSLDFFQFAQRNGTERLRYGILKCVGIDRFQEPAGEPRRDLVHGLDLNAALARARRLDAGHVPGEPRVHYDRLARAHFAPRYPVGYDRVNLLCLAMAVEL